ncbi:hypothetical protein CR513_52473, partial [Mucuna pruriens]
MLRPVDVESEPEADLPIQQQARPIQLSFPTWTTLARKFEMDEDLLEIFRRVEINIPLLDAIKQVPKYAKFLKELCIHKRKRIKGRVDTGGVVSALEPQPDHNRLCQNKYGDPGIFLVPCTIGGRTFANALLDLGASINVMSSSIYKALSFGDLKSTGMTIQLSNRNVVQPLGILEDVLVQINDLIFPVDFYVLDKEDEMSRKGSALILGRPFLMTAKTKIDVYVGKLSMEFEDNLVQLNIFEAMKHPTKDHSLFGIDIIDELVKEHIQLDADSEEMPNFVEIFNVLECVGSVAEVIDSIKMSEVSNLFNSRENLNN